MAHSLTLSSSSLKYHNNAYPDHPTSNCKPHPWYSLPWSISILFTTAFTPGILSIYLSIYLFVCVHICMCMYMNIHVCIFFLFVLTSCYNNACIIAGTQIYVILPMLVYQQIHLSILHVGSISRILKNFSDSPHSL